MRMAVLALALAPFAAGCATAPTAGEPDRLPALPEGSCDADSVQAMLGQRASQETGTQILARTGADSLRWGPPGAVFTMDFRQGRVNVMYDADMAITRIYCG